MTDDLPASQEEVPEEFQILMMGYLDNELDEEQTKKFLAYVESHEIGQRELTQYRRLVDVANSLRLREPADDERQQFWQGIYNRMERQSGWILVILGVLSLTAILVIAVAQTEMLPWYLKIGIGLLGTGFAVLFISVVRLRLRTMPYDRYRDVQR